MIAIIILIIIAVIEFVGICCLLLCVYAQGKYIKKLQTGIKIGVKTIKRQKENNLKLKDKIESITQKYFNTEN